MRKVKAGSTSKLKPALKKTSAKSATKTVAKADAKKSATVKAPKIEPKKSPPKKTVAAAVSKPHAPKSPELAPLLEELRRMLMRHSPPFETRGNSGDGVDLWGPRTVLVGKTMNKPFFAGATIQKGYLGFYFMPIYMDPDRFRKVLAPELLALLKGKSCFHIKKLDPFLRRHIQAALELGAKSYKDRDWV